MTIPEACRMASEKKPSEWPEEIIFPIAGHPISIFGDTHGAVSEDKKLGLIDALTYTTLAASNGQARTAIKAGAVRINGTKCSDAARIVSREDCLPDRSFVVLENGKYNYGIIEFC